MATASLAPIIRRARRGPRAPQIDKDSIADLLSDDKTARKERIRCPLCGWKPRAEDRWMCVCGHAWNTFDTGGRCPRCGRQWHETQCLSCGGWSRHEDWYAEEPAR